MKIASCLVNSSQEFSKQNFSTEKFFNSIFNEPAHSSFFKPVNSDLPHLNNCFFGFGLWNASIPAKQLSKFDPFNVLNLSDMDPISLSLQSLYDDSSLPTSFTSKSYFLAAQGKNWPAQIERKNGKKEPCEGVPKPSEPCEHPNQYHCVASRNI